MKVDRECLKLLDMPLVGQFPKEVNFLFVDCSFTYNAIIGRPTINAWCAATSTYHLLVKFLMEYGIREVWGDHMATRKCYIAMLEMGNHLQALNIKKMKGHCRTNRGSGRNLLGWWYPWSNCSYWHTSRPFGSWRAYLLSKKQSRRLRLESWGYAGNQSQYHGT